MPKPIKRPIPALPADWLEQVNDHLHGGEGEWSVPAEVNGKPNLPVWTDILDDWVVGVTCIKSNPFLAEYGIKQGETVGFAILNKIIC